MQCIGHTVHAASEVAVVALLPVLLDSVPAVVPAADLEVGVELQGVGELRQDVLDDEVPHASLVEAHVDGGGSSQRLHPDVHISEVGDKPGGGKLESGEHAAVVGHEHRVVADGVHVVAVDGLHIVVAHRHSVVQLTGCKVGPVRVRHQQSVGDGLGYICADADRVHACLLCKVVERIRRACCR